MWHMGPHLKFDWIKIGTFEVYMQTNISSYIYMCSLTYNFDGVIHVFLQYFQLKVF
jgi:hypothetical protein